LPKAVQAADRLPAHGTNPQLRAYARDTLPTLREHKTMIGDAIANVQC
jgi:hypothetical protein